MTKPSPDDNVETLPPSDSWSVEQVVAEAAKLGLKQVMIIGVTDDDVLVNYSSRMSRKDVIWALSEAVHHELSR